VMNTENNLQPEESEHFGLVRFDDIYQQQATPLITNEPIDFAELFHYTQTLSRILKCDQWIACLTNIATQISKATTCALVIVDEQGERQVRSVAHSPAGPIETIRQPLASCSNLPVQLIEWSYQQQQALLFYPRNYPNIADRYLRHTQPARVWSIPLLQADQCLGVLYVEHQQDLMAFGPQQRTAIELLTSHASISLANVKSFQRLHAMASQTRLLFEAASDAILLHTTQKVLDCNPAALRLFGMSREEFLATSPGQLSPQYQEDGSESASHADRIFGTLMAQGHNRFEWQHQRPNGETFWAEVGMTLLEREGDKLMHCVVRDIGDRKKAEAALKQTNESLALTNLELQRATRLKDEFLANMSHELRTPLNAILGMSEVLRDQIHGSLNERQDKSAETIERSGRHLLNLINDILDVSKIVAGKVDLELSEVSITQLCSTSLVFVKQQAFQKQIKLEVKISPQVGKISVDERRIQQVLINLLTNAVKFTPAGGRVMLEVSYACAIQGGQELIFDVRDTGIGITASDQARLFEPFIQIDSQLNRKYEGTGLGLALVKQIAELHGGRVTVQSAVGNGSCFTVHLPCQNQTTPLLPERVPLEEESNQSSPELPKQSESPLVLLVEDNEANTQTIASYLTAKGYRMLLAQNGYEAIQLNQEHSPNLILMDIQMPGMDGLEAIQRIRNESNCEVPILALTALAMAGDRARCIEAGANDYLAKPIRLKELNLTIQRWLTNNGESTDYELN
jgi:PAS domain S-box-containing protein